MIRLALALAVFALPAAAGTAPTYHGLLAGLDARIASLEKRTELDPASWLGHDRIARAWLARARLTGSFDDYAAAEARVERAFEVAAPGTGPWLTRARLNFALHRFDRVEADLARAERRILLDDRTRAEIEGLRADLAFRTGRLAGVEAGLEAEARPDVPTIARLALFHAETGDGERADALLRAALTRSRSDGHDVAWLHLQRGILDLGAGRLPEALADFRLADAALPGWWLVEAHLARTWTRLGCTEEALEVYGKVIEATDDPAFPAAVASIHWAEGRIAEAARWEREAVRRREERRGLFPAAAAAHPH